MKPTGFAIRGQFQANSREGVGGSEYSKRIDANIFHRAGINVIAGQNVGVPAGTQQALRRLKYCSGEAGMMLPGHLHDPL